MTIYDLRKIIKVVWYANNDITYELNGEPKNLYLNENALCSELTSIGSIDNPSEISSYTISQWDALNLVIRHEYTKYVEADIMGSDIGKSIDNLTK